jgi:putative DNA primase/helicase
MTGRVHPHAATKLVLRRLQSHGRTVEQDSTGGPVWTADGCPAHTGRSGMVRVDQHDDDGTVSVHPHRKDGEVVCTPETIIAALALAGDDRVRPFDRNRQPVRQPIPAVTSKLFQDPPEPEPADSYEIFERLKRALVDVGCDEGRGVSGRYRCPACGAKGDGHGLKIDHQPNAFGTRRKILLVCQANRCPVEEILDPLGMTLAQICAGDNVDDLGAEEGHAAAPLPAVTETGLELRDGLRATDVGNAARLLRQATGHLHYVHAWGKWLVYRKGRWTLDENDALVTERAKRVARELFNLAAKITDDKEERKATYSWALRSESAGSIAAMVKLSRGMPGVIVEHEQLDANPHLLNVRNGTIDLRTGALRPHDPADLITVQCPVSYDPDAKAPLWEACVERWQPGPKMREYIQIRAGAGATGIPTETVDVDYGRGANGKSKFWGAIQHVLGDYAVVPHKSLLVTQKHEQHDTIRANLFRKRLAVASETRAADTLDDEQVKALIGGDRIKGRRMREDPWEFWPSHTLIMFSNHKPAVQGRDEGIWRRLRLVPWEVTIPEAEGDDDLAGKLRGEAAGILRWLVEGARRFLSEGLTPPSEVRVATDSYRVDQDVVGRFVSEVLYFSAGYAWSADLRAELEAWCHGQGVTPELTMNDLAVVLREKGCTSGRRAVKGRQGVIWRGVQILDHTPSEQG